MNQKTNPAADKVALCPFRIVVDSREQAPYSFTGFKADGSTEYRCVPCGRKATADRCPKCGSADVKALPRPPLIIRTVSAGLPTGDYSIEGFEDRISVERKSLQDLYGTLGQGRERFERELERLSRMDFAAVVIEADWPRILSSPCGECGGSGMILQPEQEITLTINTAWINRFASLLVATALRVAVRPDPEIICPACSGTGKQHPLEGRSRLNPKTVYRSVLSWQQKFPSIHWWAAETRSFAEHTTFRILERFWKNANAESQAE